MSTVHLAVEVTASIVTDLRATPTPRQYMRIRRFAPRAASAAHYARSQGRMEQHASECGRTERSMVLGANRRLVNANSSTVHENNTVHRRNKKDGEKSSVQATSYNKLFEWFVYFIRWPGRLRFLRSYDNTASCTIYARRHAGSSQLCLFACVVALRLTCTCFVLVRVERAVLCCAVLCCACGAKKANKFSKVPQQNNFTLAIAG